MGLPLALLLADQGASVVVYDVSEEAVKLVDHGVLAYDEPGAQVVRIPETDGLPQWEKLAETKAALDAFWTR